MTDKSQLNKELTAHSEDLNTAFGKLQRKMAIVEEYAETVNRMRDQSEHRVAELDAIISSIAAGIIIYNNFGHIVRMNDYARDLLGYTAVDFHLSISDRLAKLDVCKTDGTPYPSQESPLFRALQGESVQDEEMIIKCANNRIVYISATLAPVRDSDNINGVVFVFIDNTERQREHHQKISNILESITDCFYALDNAWRFTYLNKEIIKFWNRKREDLLGKVIWEEFPETVNEPIYHYFQQAVKERTPVVFEARSVSSAGWHEFHVYPGNEGLSVYFRDITEKKHSERIMQQLAAIVENSNDAIISMNPEGIVTSWNQGAVRMYGYNASEIIGENALKIVPCEMQPQAQEILSFVVKGQESDDNSVRVCKDGTRVNVSIKTSLIRDSQGNVIEVSSIHRNVSERVKFIEGLTRERELLMITLNSLNEAVIASDRDDRIFLINETALRLTGYSRFEATDELLGKILYVLDDKTSEPIDDFSSLNASVFPVLVTRSLTEMPISIHRSPIKNDEGKIIGAVTVFQDISEKQKVMQKMIEQDKLESLGILAGGIAHDFNNVLAAILSNIQLALLKQKKNEDIKPYLMKTIETTHKASELTKQLLTFSKGGAPVKMDASLVDLIQDTAEFVLRGSKIKAEFVIPENLWSANVDTGQISQVIQNLVINAQQAMPKGGMLKIHAENVHFDERSFYKAGNYIKISVRDHGVGIPKEILPKIFDPYFTTKKDGNGLGLATSYSIITQHDGYLEVESEEGKGAVFHIYLPTSNTAVSRRESRKETAATSSTGYKILLMDDEEIILNAISEILECYGHHVLAVKDGVMAVEAYKQAQRSGEPFDLVIMDLTIPGGMGGQEAVAYLRDLDPKVKAIVSSGYANDPIMSDFERYGFAGVVNKPYKINELNLVIQKVLNSEQLTLTLSY